MELQQRDRLETLFCFFFYSLGGRQGLWEAEEGGRVEGDGLLCVTGIIGYFCFTMLMWE